MKKISVILMCIVMLLSFSTSAFAAEYTNDRITFALPEVVTQDTVWAEENGYISSWYNEDMTFEVIYYTDETGMSRVPRLQNYDEQYYVSRKYSAVKVNSSWSECNTLSELSFNGNECICFSYKISEDGTDDTVYMNIYEYVFPVDDFLSYCLTFIDYTGAYGDEAEEIASTVNIAPEKFSVTQYITEVCAIACGGTLLTGLISYIKNRKQKQ